MNDMMMQAILNELKAINRRLDTLEDGQKEIRRDVAKVDKKIDHLSSDVGQVLANVTDSVGAELKILKAK